jgi:hypothetical protein
MKTEQAPIGRLLFLWLSRLASGPAGTARKSTVVAMMPMTAMPTMMPMMMPMPTHLGRFHLGTLLHRRRGAGIGQRHRLGALGWSG